MPGNPDTSLKAMSNSMVPFWNRLPRSHAAPSRSSRAVAPAIGLHAPLGGADGPRGGVERLLGARDAAASAATATESNAPKRARRVAWCFMPLR